LSPKTESEELRARPPLAKWSTKDIPDQKGLTAIVTGANSGLGFESALALAAAGARVVLGCRDQAKGEAALKRILETAPASDVRLEQLDLANQDSIRSFAAVYSAGHDGLDILVNNAGVMAIPRRRTDDGFEMQFGTNHLGHFALTGLLADKLIARPGARVVTVSSVVAEIGRMRFDDLQSSRHYGKWIAYGQSKLANQLFTLELHRRASSKGILSIAAHPGYAATNLQGTGPRMSGSKIMEAVTNLENTVFAQTAAMGALPILYAATAPDVIGGRYFGPDQFFGMRGHPKRVRFVRAAKNPETARRLWEVSEDLTGVHYESLR
jgi:NAD(P)-dependent dehydrogenase (short-subunit alcohol dehydrogenase family)